MHPTRRQLLAVPSHYAPLRSAQVPLHRRHHHQHAWRVGKRRLAVVPRRAGDRLPQRRILHSLLRRVLGQAAGAQEARR